MASPGAIIYLAEKRRCIQDDKYRSYRTLEHPFHNLSAFNDETLAPSASIQHHSTSLIIPLVGDVVTNQRISPGQAQIINSPTISNPHNEELVNYLHLAFNKVTEELIFDFTLVANRLQQLTTTNHFYLGKFGGRRDDVYKLSGGSAGVFVFVIEGAFEVQNRLLHPRDGLALWDLTEVEFEALSNEAMLLLIEA